MGVTTTYADFLTRKLTSAETLGREAHPDEVNAALFDWQRDIVLWALRTGRAAIFADTGLGKTLMQVEWARLTGERTLILTPLAVAAQTARIAREVLGVEVRVCRDQSDCGPGINVTNYERLHLFDPSAFGAVVLDEASIIKNAGGATKWALVRAFEQTPWKLCCTATPAPNDWIELGNQAQFLGVMKLSEMLTHWFVHDSGSFRSARLKRHGAKDFWRWVRTWAVALTNPADLGYDGGSFVLPRLEIVEHVVDVDYASRFDESPDGRLFPDATMSATTMHREMRLTAVDRAERVAKIIADDPEGPWLVWCNTNYEADALVTALPDAVDVRGSESAEIKERKLMWFAGLYEEECLCGSRDTTTPGEPDTARTKSTESVGSTSPSLIETNGARTCATTSPAIESASPSGVERQHRSATNGDAPSTPKTRTTGRNARRHRDSETQPASATRGSERTSGSQPPTTTGCSKSKVEVAPSAAPRSLRTGDGSLSITATERGASEVSSARHATTDSGSSRTIPNGSSEPLCTCGRLTASRPKLLVSKPSIFGYGLNLQHCRKMAFVGLSYSYEQFYQAVRRCWRYGQTHDVTAHVVFAESEREVLGTIKAKQTAHRQMVDAMLAVDEARPKALGTAVEHRVERGERFELHLGDACEVLRDVPDESVGLSVFSPPFANLYVYSDALADMGNCVDQDEFFEHFAYVIAELHRVTIPGRLAAVHLKDLPKYRNRDGAMGLSDFPGRTIVAFEEAGFTFHSRVTIWKDPVQEMQRTKSHGLLYKQLRADSCASRMGRADYVVAFRKWVDGLDEFPDPVTHEREDFPLDRWQKWASPVWDDIDEIRVLPYQQAKADSDEAHLCPLQLPVIERCVALWSNPGDVVLSPFAGIGSEGYEALRMGRRFVGVELKPEYFEVALDHLRKAERYGQGALL